MYIQTIKQAFYKSIPVFAGYIVLGIGFGILMRNAGYGVLGAASMSIFIYAVSYIQKSNIQVHIISRESASAGNHWNVSNLLSERYCSFRASVRNPGTDCSFLRCWYAGMEAKFLNQYFDRNNNIYGAYTDGVLMMRNGINIT